MSAFLARRLVALVVTLLAASAVIFFVLEILPGDVATILAGVNATPEQLAARRAELGLDRPAIERYFDWIGALTHGDLGQSYVRGRAQVAALAGDALAISVPLAAYALILTVAIALPVGLLAAARRGRPADWGVMAVAQVFIAVPNFLVGILLVWLFAIVLGWFESGFFSPGWEGGFWPAIKDLTLPAFALALPQAAILARVARGALLETLSEDYIRTARAKGLTRRAALLRHALGNAALPILAILGLQVSFLVAGTVIVEAVFSLPGIGALIVSSVDSRDLATVRTLVLLIVAMVVVVNAVVDIVSAVIDPRLRTRPA